MKLKKILVSLLFLILSAGFAYGNFYLAKQTKDVVEVVVVKEEISKGTQITKEMLSTKEIGRFNAGSDIIKTKEEIIGKYSTTVLTPYRTLYNDNFSSDKKEKSFENNILNKAVSVNINLVGSVAAEIKENSIVKLALVQKTQSGEAKIIYPEELSKVRVLKMTMDSGIPINESEEVKKENEVAKDETKRPAALVLDITDEQAEILLPYSYSGNIHCFMLNESDAQAYREKIGIEGR